MMTSDKHKAYAKAYYAANKSEISVRRKAQRIEKKKNAIALLKAARAERRDTRELGKCARCVWCTTLTGELVACAFGRCVQQGAALGQQMWTMGAET